MKNLFDRFFNKEIKLNYVIAEYKPSGNYIPKPPVEFSEYELDSLASNDEMEIDNLYQKN